jgi:hypothetical protein
MATRKKKSESTDILKPIKAIAGKWPKIDIGTHLTVTTYEDGTTLMEWDHEALQRECEAAIASVEKK